MRSRDLAWQVEATSRGMIETPTCTLLGGKIRDFTREEQLAGFGDTLCVRGGVEFKAERKRRENLFVETESNRLICRKGWAWTCRATWLAYHVMGNRRVYLMSMRELHDWLKENEHRFELKPQSTFDQPNETWGRCIPIRVILAEIRSARDLGEDMR